MRERIWWYLGALLVLPVVGMAIGGEYGAHASCAGDHACEFAGMGEVLGAILAALVWLILVVVVEGAIKERARRQGFPRGS